jgi:hypothetical protein
MRSQLQAGQSARTFIHGGLALCILVARISLSTGYALITNSEGAPLSDEQHLGDPCICYLVNPLVSNLTASKPLVQQPKQTLAIGTKEKLEFCA